MTTCTHRCGCTLAHEPAQALADLLKAAVEVDYANKMIAMVKARDHGRDTDEWLDFMSDEERALHAAVERLS